MMEGLRRPENMRLRWEGSIPWLRLIADKLTALPMR